MGTGNVYLPLTAEVLRASELAKDVVLLALAIPASFSYRPGQFVMVSVLGAGEIPISITSSPRTGGDLEICVRAVGRVSAAVTSLRRGDRVGIRGPYGKPFPRFDPSDDTLFVCGGIGLVPIRPLIHEVLAAVHPPGGRGSVTVIYGARTPAEVLFREEIPGWEERGARVVMTVDTCDVESWEGCTGLVTEHFGKAGVDYRRCTAYLCGPHPMIRAAARDLARLGVPDERIITTLEAHMKCGVGKCGHCFCGGKLICEEGPVFSLREIKAFGIEPGLDGLG